MKSPFPGMDPYLERHWGDVHATLMVYARNQLNAQLPDDLQARVEESLSVEVEGDHGNGHSRTIYPDVRIVEDLGGSPSRPSVAAVAVAEPFVIKLDEPRTERHIEIVEVGGDGRVITAIEVLSPANKDNSAGRKAYRQKQEEYLLGGINLVEIDLIRDGDYVLSAPRHGVPDAYEEPYLICIRRAALPSEIELYHAPLRERLPNIPIPLRRHEEDVVLQIQPLIDACYHDGRYDRTDYRRPLSPKLAEADAAWADGLLRQAGLR